MYYDRYMPIEAHSKKADSDEATDDKVEFELPYEVQGVIAQVRQDDDDEVDPAGLKVTVDNDGADTTVTVEVTELSENDIVTIIAFK